MNKELQFFNYELCYKQYAKFIGSMKPKIINGETIVAKPVFLVAIIDGIENNVFISNKFSINDWLEERYMKLMTRYTKNSQFNDVTGIEKPFWHLETDGFWHLNYPGERLGKGRTPSKAWLKENVEFAYFDEPLWILLQNCNWRSKIRDYIVSWKLDIKGIGNG